MVCIAIHTPSLWGCIRPSNVPGGCGYHLAGHTQCHLHIDDILATRADDAAHLSHLAEVLKLMCHHVHTSTTSVVPTELWLKPKPLKMYFHFCIEHDEEPLSAKSSLHPKWKGKKK